MSYNNTITSTYAGKAAVEYISPALVGSSTLLTDGIKILTNVKYKYTIKKFSSSNLIQSYTTDFTDGGSTAITEKVLQPKSFSVNKKWAIQDFWNTWDSESLSAGANNDDVPAEIQKVVFKDMGARIATDIESKLWTSTGGTYPAGYLSQLNGSAIEITGITLTASNITAQLSRVVKALPDAIRERVKDLVIYIPRSAAQVYRDSLMAQGINTTTELQILQYGGIEVRPVSLPDNVIVSGMRENFYFATDLEDDFTNIGLVNMQHQGDNHVRFFTNFKYDVGCGFVNEIVLYNF